MYGAPTILVIGMLASIWGKKPEEKDKKKTASEVGALAWTARSLLHIGRIRDLADQLESRAGTLKFLETCLQMLPAACSASSTESMTATRMQARTPRSAWKVASSMTGALSAEACCLELESLVRGKQFGLALVSARWLSTGVAALYETAPEILFEVHRDRGGVAAWTPAVGSAAKPGLGPQGRK
jgi:hypothetical protein